MKEMADKVGLSRSSYSKYEIGYGRPLDVGFYDAFAGALGIDSIQLKELDPRCEEYGKREAFVELESPDWETVKGGIPG